MRHGHAAGSETPEYRVWRNIKDRCFNPNNPRYSSYGGRGVSMCEEWVSSFEAFFEAVGKRPTPAHSLDRTDNDGNYEPGNVRWTTLHTQSRNKRVNVLLTHDDRTMVLQDWAAEIGCSPSTLRRRLLNGWGVEKSLTTPPHPGKAARGGRRGKLSDAPQ